MRTKGLIKKDLFWTAELAYLIGLITTDGSLSKDGRHIDFTSKDLEQIQTFKCLIDSKNKIGSKKSGSGKSSYRIQISNVKFYDFLLSIGLYPNKSLTLGALRINENYFRDFLRGSLDGDGSIIRYKDRYNTKINSKYIYERLFVYFISASKKHLIWLRKNISDKINVHGSINLKRHPCYALKFSTKEAKVLLQWIYYDSNLPRLERKYKIAEPFLV